MTDEDCSSTSFVQGRLLPSTRGLTVFLCASIIQIPPHGGVSEFGGVLHEGEVQRDRNDVQRMQRARRKERREAPGCINRSLIFSE